MISGISGSALAGTCSTNLCDGKTNLLYVHENTDIYLKVDADGSSLNCQLSGSGSLTLLKNNPMQSEMYSLLLSANLADREVRVRIDDSDPQGICEILYVQLMP